jgi:hypothetical protein
LRRVDAADCDDLVKTRTQTINWVHVVLTNLIPGRAPRALSADRAAGLLRGIPPRDPAGQTLRGLAVDLVVEVRHLDRRITKAESFPAKFREANVSTDFLYRKPQPLP